MVRCCEHRPRVHLFKFPPLWRRKRDSGMRTWLSVLMGLAILAGVGVLMTGCSSPSPVAPVLPSPGVTMLQISPDTILVTTRMDRQTSQVMMTWSYQEQRWKLESMPIIIVDPRT